MGQIVAVFPDLPSFRQTLTLGDAQFGLRLTWRERPAGWYADLYTATGAPVWLGQRLSPGWPLGHGLHADGAPDGVMLVRGPYEYTRGDLGATLEIVFYSTSELPVVAAESDGLSVTVP
jgi:hypothetical protein